MSSETDTLERQAEQTRARLSDTAETLRAKMSPGQLVDEFTSAFRGGDGSVALDNLKAQIRDNPLPLALVGAGLAWLMLGNGGPKGSATASRPMHTAAGEPPYGQPPAKASVAAHGSIADTASGLVDRAKSAMSDAYEVGSDALKSAAGTVSDTVATATAHTAATGRSAYDSAASSASGATHQIQSMRNVASDLLEREPLITAAIGVALGLAVGAVLPQTEIENQQMGGASDRLKDQTKQMVSEGLDTAKSVASESFDALKQAADAEGLNPGGTPLADKLGSVVKTAVSAGEEAFRDQFAQSDDA